MKIASLSDAQIKRLPGNLKELKVLYSNIPFPRCAQ
jgi:hypothetical protein